ncbi:hypothetical protein DM785_02300 [Deinococcus actinosclerus]|nr:hypothetical protein DM785_02300 [Deinococcus actinosclerus]
MGNAEVPVSLLAGVDWLVVGYALGMATLMSVLTTLRLRNEQHLAQPDAPVPGWWTLIPDTLLGGVVGTLAALFLPEVFPVLKTFAGLSLSAGVGGILGPRLVDWVGSNGVDTLLSYVGSGAGRLARAVEKRREAGGDGDSKNPDAQ